MLFLGLAACSSESGFRRELASADPTCAAPEAGATVDASGPDSQDPDVQGPDAMASSPEDATTPDAAVHEADAALDDVDAGPWRPDVELFLLGVTGTGLLDGHWLQVPADTRARLNIRLRNFTRAGVYEVSAKIIGAGWTAWTSDTEAPEGDDPGIFTITEENVRPEVSRDAAVIVSPALGADAGARLEITVRRQGAEVPAFLVFDVTLKPPASE